MKPQLDHTIGLLDLHSSQRGQVGVRHFWPSSVPDLAHQDGRRTVAAETLSTSDQEKAAGAGARLGWASETRTDPGGFIRSRRPSNRLSIGRSTADQQRDGCEGVGREGVHGRIHDPRLRLSSCKELF